MSFLRPLAFAALLLSGALSALRAADGPLEFTLDFPVTANQATPAWLGHPQTPATTFATLDLPITPPDATASLFMTVYFEEKAGGFLRISWQSQLNAQVLCDNFYEGIGMTNQRSLLVSADEMKTPGVLRFQCGDQALGITRIKLEWLEGATGLASPAINDVLITPADGSSKFASDLTGEPKPADQAMWHDRIVNVPITETPLRVEQGVDFSLELDSVPAAARLSVKESGLPWGQHLVLWVNNVRAGTVAPAVPDLTDGGFPVDKTQPYMGWREGTLLVPTPVFNMGGNTIQFSAEPDDAASTAAPAPATEVPAPLAIKDAVVQFDYPVTPANAATTVTLAPPVLPSSPATDVPNLPETTSASAGNSGLLFPGAYAAASAPATLETPAPAQTPAATSTNSSPSNPTIP